MASERPPKQGLVSIDIGEKHMGVAVFEYYTFNTPKPPTLLYFQLIQVDKDNISRSIIKQFTTLLQDIEYRFDLLVTRVVLENQGNMKLANEKIHARLEMFFTHIFALREQNNPALCRNLHTQVVNFQVTDRYLCCPHDLMPEIGLYSGKKNRTKRKAFHDRICRQLMQTYGVNSALVDYYNLQAVLKKCDDLADAYIQGLSYATKEYHAQMKMPQAVLQTIGKSFKAVRPPELGQPKECSKVTKAPTEKPRDSSNGRLDQVVHASLRRRLANNTQRRQRRIYYTFSNLKWFLDLDSINFQYHLQHDDKLKRSIQHYYQGNLVAMHQHLHGVDFQATTPSSKALAAVERLSGSPPPSGPEPSP